jgi:predicted Ser/Thr protein kinase
VSSSPAVLPGALADRYTLDRQLGKGASGSVFLVQDCELDRPAALKFLSVRGRNEIRGRFTQEARLTASLRHPGIVEIYDHGLEDDQAYIVYEYLEGRDLEVVASAGPSDAAQVAAWGGELAAALQTVHEAGVIHRDVKPANVLVRVDGSAVLGDFGLARPDGPREVQTATGMVMGTLHYLAPEILQGEVASPASDLYALGATLYRVLTGTDLVPQRELGRLWNLPAEEFDAVIAMRMPGVAPRLEEALARLLRADPAARFPDAATAQAALAAAGPRRGAARPRRKETPRKRGRRVRRGAIAAGFVGLGLATWWWRAPGPPAAPSAEPRPAAIPAPPPAEAETRELRAVLDGLRRAHIPPRPSMDGPEILSRHLKRNAETYLDPDLPGRWGHFLHALGEWERALREAPEEAVGSEEVWETARLVGAWGGHYLMTLSQFEGHALSLVGGFGRGAAGLGLDAISQIGKSWGTIKLDTQRFLREVETPGVAPPATYVLVRFAFNMSQGSPEGLWAARVGLLLDPATDGTLRHQLYEGMPVEFSDELRIGGASCEERAAALERLEARWGGVDLGSQEAAWRVHAVQFWLLLARKCAEPERWIERGARSAEGLLAFRPMVPSWRRDAWEFRLKAVVGRHPRVVAVMNRVDEILGPGGRIPPRPPRRF